MTVLNWTVFMYCESSKQIQLTALCALMCIVWSMPTSSNICNQFAVTSSFLLLVSRSCSGPISCCHVSLRTARCKRLVHVRKSWRTGSTSGTNDRKKKTVLRIIVIHDLILCVESQPLWKLLESTGGHWLGHALEMKSRPKKKCGLTWSRHGCGMLVVCCIVL